MHRHFDQSLDFHSIVNTRVGEVNLLTADAHRYGDQIKC